MEYEDFLKKYGPNFDSFSNGVTEFVLTWDDAKENVHLILRRDEEHTGDEIAGLLTDTAKVSSAIFNTAEFVSSEDVIFPHDPEDPNVPTPIWIFKVDVNREAVEL